MDTIETAKEVFSHIEKKFPHLKMLPDTEAPVELCVNIPTQPGLKYKVNLNLQNNDELHFSVSNFWLEWFPCTNPDVKTKYIESVCGFLSGEYRILEQFRGNKCTKAELQMPLDSDWKTIGRTHHIAFVFPWTKKHTSIIRNI